MIFRVLMVVSVDIMVLWDVTPCGRGGKYAAIFRLEEVTLKIEAALRI